MRPKDVLELLSFYFTSRMAVMLTGAPGIGKTDIVTAAAAKAGARLIITHPVTADPTDAKGLPFPSKDGKSANFLPYGDLLTIINATEPTVVFLDDLGQAPPAVQASYMQLILARRINQHVVPNCVTFAAATNRRTDRAGVTGILEPVKSRFAAILPLEANFEDWKVWAYDHEIPAELIAFLSFKKNLFSEAWKASQDIEAQPCPRTWAFAAKTLNAKLNPRIETLALGGTVGEAAAGELQAFLRMHRQLPAIEDILKDVDAEFVLNIDGNKIKTIPDEPATLYSIATSMAMAATQDNFGKVARYAERLVDAEHGEHAILLVRDAVRRDRTLYETKAFTKMTTSKVGQLFRGDEN